MLITQQSVFDAYTATPNDSADLPKGACKGIYIGDGAPVNLNVMMQGGETVRFSNIALGQIHWIAAKRIMATDTTATDILVLY